MWRTAILHMPLRELRADACIDDAEPHVYMRMYMHMYVATSFSARVECGHVSIMVPLLRNAWSAWDCFIGVRSACWEAWAAEGRRGTDRERAATEPTRGAGGEREV